MMLAFGMVWRGVWEHPGAARPGRFSAIRLAGVAISLERHIRNVSAVAAPVFDADGSCVAALTVAGPTERFRAALESFVVTIKDVAARASGAIQIGSDRRIV